MPSVGLGEALLGKLKKRRENMVEIISQYLVSYGMNEELSVYISNFFAAVIIILISALAYLVARKIVLRVLRSFISKSRSRWGEILLKNSVFERITSIVPAFVIHSFAPVFPSFQDWIQRIAFCYIVLAVLLALDKLLDSVDDIYKNYEVSKMRPIKGYLQVVKIGAFAIGIIIIISALMDRSPLLLISGIGAATAVLLLVFQNSILGFVAGLQLSANNMVQLDDWIEMPQYRADGEVIEISLHTVKVQNWDRTITTIPTNALVSESFKNWKGMEESGGRRIKRAINLDMTSIKFCDEEMLDRYKEIQYIKDYIENKEKEIGTYNQNNDIDSANMANGRHLTNIGTFRAYIVNYLKNHPKVHKGMTRMVRQLDPTEKGLPIEVYVFLNETEWVSYEAIQADIFDHIMAVIPEFDLRIFQSPGWYDMRCMQKSDS